MYSGQGQTEKNFTEVSDHVKSDNYALLIILVMSEIYMHHLFILQEMVFLVNSPKYCCY
jgi:hypothetical protein